MIAAAHHHVLWFDIAMDNIRFMGCVQRRGNLHRNVEDLVQLQAREHVPAQRDPIDKLGHDKTLVFFLSKFVDGENVRMIERGNCLGFLDEALHSLRIGRDLGGQQFDRDCATQLTGIKGQIHFAHPALADL